MLKLSVCELSVCAATKQLDRLWAEHAGCGTYGAHISLTPPTCFLELPPHGVFSRCLSTASYVVRRREVAPGGNWVVKVHGSHCGGKALLCTLLCACCRTVVVRLYSALCCVHAMCCGQARPTRWKQLVCPRGGNHLWTPRSCAHTPY